MSHIRLTKNFTTDERADDVVSIAVEVSEDPDELWRRSLTRGSTTCSGCPAPTV